MHGDRHGVIADGRVELKGVRVRTDAVRFQHNQKVFGPDFHHLHGFHQNQLRDLLERLKGRHELWRPRDVCVIWVPNREMAGRPLRPPGLGTPRRRQTGLSFPLHSFYVGQMTMFGLIARAREHLVIFGFVGQLVVEMIDDLARAVLSSPADTAGIALHRMYQTTLTR